MDYFIEETTPHSNKRESDSLSSKNKMKRLSFLLTGTKKYKFTLEAEMKMLGLLTKTKTETSWILQCNEISESGYVFDLVSYNTILSECDTEGFEQLFHITRQFQKLYDEIKFKVDLQGNLLKVINSEQLTEKWKFIKSEVIKYFNDEMTVDHFFKVNDQEFSKPEFINKLIKEVEFFMVYLQLSGYGKKLDSWVTSETKRENAFRTGEILWDLEFWGKREIISDSPLGKMVTKGSFQPNKKWLEKAYGEIPHIKVEELHPEFSINANYLFYNKSGWLKEAVVELNEIVDTQILYHKMKYIIKEID